MAHICVVLGSVREGRQGLRVARMIINNLEQLGARTTLLDPLEINPPMLQQPLHFMKVKLCIQYLVFNVCTLHCS